MNNIFIDRLIPGGQSIGTGADGKKGLFWNALPGETVTEYTITKSKSHYFEAIATKIKNPSVHRIKPKDDCYLSTSPWQIMDYNYELTQKSELLKEVFRQVGLNLSSGDLSRQRERRTGSVPVTNQGSDEVRACSAPRNDADSDPKGQTGDATDASEETVKTDSLDFFYRNKMEYSLYWDKSTEKISLAFHQRGSHRKIPITHSSIERPEILAAAQKIIDTLNANGEEARKYQGIILRCDQNGNISGGLLENYKPHPVFDNLTDIILGHEYSYSPNGFFQINLPVYEMALREIQSHINTENVLDLYAGVGTIGLSVARDKKLTLVECNKAAFQELEKNCKSAASSQSSVGTEPNCVLSNSEDALEYIQPDQTVILDPPRAGCDKKLVDKLLTVMPKTIIYLSCNPATQARDIKLLSEKYHIKKITPYNFFPRTPHLENLVILEKN